MTTTTENVVAEWRAAMEEVPDGEIERAFIVDGHGEAIQGEAVLYLPDDNEAEFRGSHAEVISAWFERCSPSGISGLLALIESQRAELAKLRAENAALRLDNDRLQTKACTAVDQTRAAEARVTALEAEKAGAIKLADGYGIVLMMIAAGCSDPQRFAKRMLAEYEAEAKKMEPTK